ncbi:MAG: hypothetical protein GY797_17710 [Deltaproteobacteria bacterium]|nr:hypothetical protein [Deltaproteobacteria bacterium]
MGTKFDHRPQWTHILGRFKIADVEAIETMAPDGDLIIRLKNGDDHYYRCSCAITFENGNLIIN